MINLKNEIYDHYKNVLKTIQMGIEPNHKLDPPILTLNKLIYDIQNSAVWPNLLTINKDIVNNLNLLRKKNIIPIKISQNNSKTFNENEISYFDIYNLYEVANNKDVQLKKTFFSPLNEIHKTDEESLKTIKNIYDKYKDNTNSNSNCILYQTTIYMIENFINKPYNAQTQEIQHKILIEMYNDIKDTKQVYTKILKEKIIGCLSSIVKKIEDPKQKESKKIEIREIDNVNVENLLKLPKTNKRLGGREL